MRKLLSAFISSLLFAGTLNTSFAGDIASVDTGVLPGSLGGALLPGGFDFVNNDSDPIDDEPGQHGTEAALSARSAVGNTRILPIKAYGADFGTNSTILTQALNFAAEQGVRAVSHSIASIQDTPTNVLQNVTGSGKILVMQAGNAAAPGPTGDASKVSFLGGRGIAVGGLLGGDIWSASNRAGNLRDFFLVADVVSPNGIQVGTSMSTPRVAAVAAEVAGRFPFLAPEQVVQILFQSATDLGSPGIDNVFGHGEVNLNAAVAAVGAGEIPSGGGGGDSGGGGGGGGGSGLAVAALVVGGAVAYTLYNRKEDLKKTIFVDSFGRAYNIDLSTRTTVKGNTSVFNLVHAQQNPLTIVPVNQTDNSQTYAFVSDRDNTQSIRFNSFNTDNGGDALTSEQQIGFRHYTDNGKTDYSMGLNADLSGDFGALSLSDQRDRSAHAGRFQYSQVFTTPILGYSAQGSSFRYGWNGDQQSHRFGVAVINDQEQYGHESNSVLYENRMQRDNLKLGFQMGALLEDGNLLGGASDGAFSADQTNTYYLGLNGAYELSSNVSVIGGYFQGLSQVDENPNALLDQFTDIRTEGYGVGLLVDNALSQNGSFGISYSSPMQTTSGSARLTLPTSQNPISGRIGFEQSRLSFDGADQEKIMEAYYGYQLTRKSDVFAHVAYTSNPSGGQELSRDRSFYVGWKRAF